MKRVPQYIVIPFRWAKGRAFPGEMRRSSSEELAVALAERMSNYWAGVVALEVAVDKETGEMFEPRELAVFGNAPDLQAEAA